MANIVRLSKEELAAVLRQSGCPSADVDFVSAHIESGAPVNEDGTVDFFDYTAWLIGKPDHDPGQRTPPSETPDWEAVAPKEIAGWLTLYNHIGHAVSASRVTSMFKQFGGRFRSSKNAARMNFFRFAAFCCTHRPHEAVVKTDDERYRIYKDKMNARNKAIAAAARDIGELPEVADQERKDACREDFGLFCETYFPNTFELEFCEDQLKCIATIQKVVLEGGLFALALPRGTGKSTMCEAAVIWAMLYGHHPFVCLVGASESAAIEMLDSIKVEIETNELIAEDFPEVAYPIQCLDGIANRCAGQTYHGERTRISWTANEITLPSIAGAASSGTTVHVAGITGRIRGMKYKRSDGKTIRPSLVIIDDPQTRESACSLEQNKKRIQTLSGDILGLAGPGKKISGIMPCTVIQQGDMADTILDREKHPDWNGEKTKLLYKFPDDMALWDEYAEIRADSLREYGNFEKATKFYEAHREEMDKGAIVEWEARHDHDEVSALQNAMNLYYRDPVSFAAEYQNEPLQENIVSDDTLSADEICRKTNGLQRGVVPLECTKLTMFVDVQKTMLFYCVCAWSDDFTGAVIDYGEYPKQTTQRFTLNSSNHTLQTEFSHKSLEGQIFSGLQNLFALMMTTVFIREDGLEMQIDKAAIDANWGVSTDTVYQFCRQSGYLGKIIPSHGRYIGAASKPMSEYRKQPGDKIGFNWRIPSTSGTRAIRHVVFDTNFWKSFVHSRLAMSHGDAGNITLFGASPYVHELFSEHLTAEFKVRTAGRGRVVDEWKLRPDRSDNHWLDCLVGCAVLASMTGSAIPEQLRHDVQKAQMKLSERLSPRMSDMIPSTVATDAAREKPKVMKLSELLKEKRK